MSSFQAPTPNYSLFSIPAYFLLSITPHLYSSTLLTPSPKTTSSSSTNKDKPLPKNLYNLSNPRSTQNQATYATHLPPDTYAKYERCRAAHTNMLENSAFFVSAVLAGIVARCDPAWMNWIVLAYLATRVAYTVTYVGVRRGPWALLRTVWFFAGNAVLFRIWWVAGLRVMDGQY